MPDYNIHVCKHCGTQCSGVYCNDCKKAEGRRAVDEANRKINPKFRCKVCEDGWYSTNVQSPSLGNIKIK